MLGCIRRVPPALLLACLLPAATAAAEDGDAVEIDYAYPTGAHVLRYHIEQRNTVSGATSAEMTIDTDITIPLAVRAAEPEDARDVTMTVQRIVAVLTAGEMEKEVDSDRPDTLLPGMPMHLLKEVDFEAKIDPAGDVTEFTGAGEFVRKAEMAPDDEAERKEHEKAIGAGMRQLLAEPLAYLPEEPVAVGDTWTYTADVYGLPVMGARKVSREETTCTLAEIRDTADGRVACIDVSGTSKFVSGAAETDPETLKKTGRVEYNIDTNGLVRHHIELTGERHAEMGEGAELVYGTEMVIDTSVEPAEDETKE